MYSYLSYCIAAYLIVFISLIAWFIHQFNIEKKLNNISKIKE